MTLERGLGLFKSITSSQSVIHNFESKLQAMYVSRPKSGCLASQDINSYPGPM
jgi:hypothetical protein